MKNILIVVLVMIIMVIMLSSASVIEIPVLDDLIGGEDSTDDSTSYSSTNSGSITITECVFYYYSNGIRKSTTDISSVPNDTRGYFVYNNVAYYCIKSNGSNSCGTNLELDSLTYNVDKYNYCCLYTEDMKNTVEYSNGQMTFDNPALIVYATTDSFIGVDAAHQDLLANQAVNLGYYDLGNSENPGSE